jgi:hypothetical protein
MLIGNGGRLICAFGLALALAISARPTLADEALTQGNKNLVRNFYTTVLIGRDVDAAPRFLRPDYIQHNPQVPTGLRDSWIRSVSVSLKNYRPITSASY